MADAYLFGHVSTGTILRLKQRYPAANGYAEVAEVLENHSGEAASGALVLAALGASVVLEGNWIGDTPACRRTLEVLRARSIDCSGLLVKPGYAGVNEVVISDSETRTVFGRYIDLLFSERQWEWPSLEKIEQARVVCVDPSFGEATLRVARQARSRGLPLVTSDARHDSELCALADVIVLSDEMMSREYPDTAASRSAREALFSEYLRNSPGLVVFTAGAAPLWYGRRECVSGSGSAARTELAPFPVDVVDSAGAGDAFRAGLVYSLLRGWGDVPALRFASAVAALVCQSAPGCLHAPSIERVQRFLSERGQEFAAL